MGAFTCGQYLAMSPAMSRDFSAWMSGWFSYQTRRTFVDLACAREKYREPEIVVPIASARKRDDGLAERDWPAVTFWIPEKSDEMECFFRSSDFAGGRFAARCSSDQRRYESDHCGGWLGYSPEERISSAFG